MYGYEVILMSPGRDRQIGLRFMSDRRHGSVISLLREQGEYRAYRSWTMLSFRCVYAANPRDRPREVARSVARPGTLLTTSA